MKTATSKRELARGLGKSEATIRKWLKDDRWPFGQTGPWDVAKVRTWARQTLTPDYAAGARPKKGARKKARRARGAKAAAAGPELVDQDGAEDPEGKAGADDDEATEERRVNILLKRERIKSAQFKREVDGFRHQLEQGQYLKREDVERRWVGIAHEVKTTLLNLPDAVVPALQGLSDPEQREVLRGRITEALRHLAEAPGKP